MKTIAIRPEIAGFEAYNPGLSIDEIKDKYGLERIIKLASNENPLGASPVARAAIKRKADYVFRYPQAGSPRLSQALADRLGTDPARIVTGNGSDEIIDLLLRVLATPGQDNVLAFDPCFSIYKTQARLCGVELRQAPLTPDFRFDFDSLLSLADANTRIVFVTSPDNPTGCTATADELADVAARLPEGCLLAIDEAYIEFTDPQDRYTLLPRLAEFPNVAILRTFSKIFGLAGLRLGYGILPSEVADYCLRVKLPFSVNLLAEEAGLSVLADDTFLNETVSAVIAGRNFLMSELPGLGFDVYPSMANFIMVRPPKPARYIFDELLKRGVIIRHLKGFNLPDHLRISVGSAEENAILIDALKQVLKA